MSATAKLLKEYPKRIGDAAIVDSTVDGLKYNDVFHDITDTVNMSNDEEAQKFLVFTLMAAIYTIKNTFGADRAVKEAQYILEVAQDLQYREEQELKAIQNK